MNQSQHPCLRIGRFHIHDPKPAPNRGHSCRVTILGKVVQVAENSMQTLHLLSVLTLISVLIYPAGAAIRPSFRLDYSSFHATDIVLVRTVADDDSFEVLESWKGNSSVGERLVIPELRPAANAFPISAYPQSWPNGNGWETIPKQPLGSRMILFLRTSASGPNPPSSPQANVRGGWLPSDLMNTMKASVVWMDGVQTYCFRQNNNPGPSTLDVLPYSLEQLRNRVSEIVDIQRDMALAVAAQDGHQRAEALKPYARSEILPVQQFALEQLGKSGPSAVPTIRGMLNDPVFAGHASELVEALLQAGGTGAGQDLDSLLLRELAFWKSTAPSLRQGWWNADTSIHAPLREEYGKTINLVIGIGQIHYSPALASVTQLRNLWRSQPQLNDPSGTDRMVEECDKSISQLQTN